MKPNIIIDCDPGQDDAVAITVALANQDQLNILGITTVGGNQTVEKTSSNALKVLEYCGYANIPVAKGYGDPLIGKVRPAGKIHGESGLDGPDFPPLHTQPVRQHAIDFLKEKIQSSVSPVTIVTMGPLTNIGLLLKTYPYLGDNIERIICMGGGIYTGNILPKAEFNIWQDPECAQMVFQSSVPVVLVPIEACREGYVDLNEAEKRLPSGKIAGMIKAIFDFYSRHCVLNEEKTAVIFDLTTIVYLLHPEYFTTEEMTVSVELEGKSTRGMTVCDFRKTANKEKTTIVVTHTNRELFNQFLYQSIQKIDDLKK